MERKIKVRIAKSGFRLGKGMQSQSRDFESRLRQTANVRIILKIANEQMETELKELLWIELISDGPISV